MAIHLLYSIVCKLYLILCITAYYILITFIKQREREFKFVYIMRMLETKKFFVRVDIILDGVQVQG
jgi:hypothetical protein